MQNKQNKCGCSSNLKLIFPCSGGADVGLLGDKSARDLTQNGKGSMSCLAGIGGNVSGIVESAKAAQLILVIDGCPLECAKKTLLNADIRNIRHLKVTDLGMKKGSTQINKENLSKCVSAAEKLLQC